MTYLASKPMQTRILAALRKGQMHKRMLCNELGTDYPNIQNSLRRLLDDGTVIILGTAGSAGYTGVQKSAPVYGLAGTKLVKATATDRLKPNGSGVIAVPCREREFRELRRDPFVLRDLALLTR